jgi:hypothetical protein
MPWACPACKTLIRPQLIAAGDDRPLPGKIYRCAVCRLELVLNDTGTQMAVAPRPATDTPPNSKPPSH